MDEVKHKSRRNRDSDRDDLVESKRSERDKERNGEKHKVRDRDREREREKHREKEKDLKHKEKEKEKERARRSREEEKEREREKKKEREREREKEKERERVREKERARIKEREEKERERERERERIREKEHREREREREREKDRDRRREKRRELERDDDSDGKEHDRKRRRSDEEYRERERERSKSDRHREDNDDGITKKHVEEDPDKKTGRSREEELEEEQRKLDEEMDKRRRRVQEWQELKRKKEEPVANSEELKPGKIWSLERESDDDEAAPIVKSDNDMDVDENAKELVTEANDPMVLDSGKTPEVGGEGSNEEEIDPLDAFMNAMVLPEVEKLSSSDSATADKSVNPEKHLEDAQLNGNQSKKGLNRSIGRIIPGEDSDSDHEDLENEEVGTEDEDDDEFIKRVKKTKVEKLPLVDHSKMQYPPFRKNFYIEVKEVSRMTAEEVATYRKELELKIHGKDVPKPIKSWVQTGLTSKVLDTIKKCGFEKPMSIQAQALPVIMSGRDCIGVAKTGSGKTLAFVLPMLRHIKDQPPVVSGDGPIGLIMAPTRELVQQIHSDIKKFAKVIGLTCVPVYGGSGVAQQISDLKRGCEIVVCTPGRMIDVLCTSNGKITNLRRVTYLVMDEADRMFDMGFEPQITQIVQNIQPDRQTVLFSATFPRQVEILARKVLNKPVEILVGGRSVVNKDITQLVEMRPESDRFLRLLELLGEWSEKGKVLIFVQTHEKCDELFRDLLKHGYPCLSLHGAKDQTDRESTISDFKSNVCNLLVATSIASRGLDVKELELVINYDVPNHYEDYVHRVGRTGRAGRKGCAITFLSEDDARYAPDLVKALEMSEQAVPADLKALADGFMVKVNQGVEKAHGTGYGGSGFKFNDEEDEVRKAAMKAQAREYGYEEDRLDSEDDDDDGVRKTGDDFPQPPPLPLIPVPIPGVPGLPSPAPSNDARTVAILAAIRLQQSLAKIHTEALPEHYEAELEINEFSQPARWKVTHKDTIGPISEWTGAAITTRGQYYPPGKIPAPGERKLYLRIEGQSEASVKKAKIELRRVLEEASR